MTKQTPGIKIPFFRESQYPIVEGTRCVEVRIPDAPEFMPVLAGLVKLATRSFNYVRDDREKAWALGNMWKAAYDHTDWEGCMDCEGVQDCIETNEGTREAIRLLAGATNPAGQEQGQPLSSERMLEDLAGTTNPGCDDTILKRQCRAAVVKVNRAITDVLEKIEVTSNSAELLDALDNFPLITYVANAVGVDFVLSMTNYIQQAVTEGYIGQYDEAAEIDLATSLYCQCQEDCVINIDRMYEAFYGRVSDIVTEPFDDLAQLALLVAGIDVGGTDVVDLMFWFALATTKVANFLFAGTLDRGLDMLIQGSADDAELDFTPAFDCPTAWEHDFDFTAVSMPEGWTVTDGAHVVGFGVSITADQGGGLFFGRISYDPSAGFECTQFILQFTSALTDSFGQIFSPSDGSSYNFNFDMLAGSETEQSGTGLPADFSADAFLCGVGGAPANTMFLTGVHIEGFGFDPFV